MLNKAIQKVSASLKPADHQIVEGMTKDSYLGIDETGHKDNGDKYWRWCFQTPEYPVFHIDKSRGSKALLGLLGKKYEGIIGSDFWKAYRKFSKLGKAAKTYFRFLTDTNFKPINNGTERETRHTIIDRRTKKGTRVNTGMR